MITFMSRPSWLRTRFLTLALALCGLSYPLQANGDPDPRVPALKVTSGYGVEGLVLWLAADSGLKTNESDEVRGIIDKTKNFVLVPNDLESTPLLIPKGLNDLPVLRFDGTQFLTTSEGFGHALNRDMTLACVAMSTAASINRLSYPLYLGANRSVGANRAFACLEGKYLFDGQYIAFNGNALIRHAFQIVIASIDSTLSQVTFYHGGEALQGVINPKVDPSNRFIELSDGVTLGGATGSHAGWKGDVAEAMVFNHALSPEEARKLETNLAAKYNLH